MNENFSLINKTRSKTPSLPFLQIKDKILGEKYELSLVFIGEKRSKDLNLKYRNKNHPANILSFPLNRKVGEMFINLKKAKREAPNFDKNQKEFLAYLFVHGLLHLKGFGHGEKMEKEEKKALKYLTQNNLI